MKAQDYSNLGLLSISAGPIIGWLIFIITMALNNLDIHNVSTLLFVLFVGLLFAYFIGFIPALMFGLYWVYLVKRGNSKLSCALKYSLVCTVLLLSKFVWLDDSKPVRTWLLDIKNMGMFDTLTVVSWLTGLIFIIFVNANANQTTE